MAKAGGIVTLTLTPDQSRQFAAILGASDTRLLTMPANRVEVVEYRGGESDGLITLHLRVTRLSAANRKPPTYPATDSKRKPTRRKRTRRASRL
jgi:hypothetical protein